MSPRPTTAKDLASSRGEAIEHLFTAAREGIYVSLVPQAGPAGIETAIAVNPCLRRILGYPPESPDAAISLFAPEHYADAAARAQLLEALFSSAGVTDYLVQLRRTDGGGVWVEVTAHTEPAGAGMLSVNALVRDVTERRQLDTRARDLYQQLVQSEQRAVIDRSIAYAAHELVNPLATVVLWAEQLNEQALDDRTRRGVTEILSAAERATRIVRNAKYSPNQKPSTRALIDINAVVDETLRLRQYDQRALNITSTVVLGTGLPPIFADASQLQQLLLNIIINAEHAMTSAHGRGALTVRTSADDARRIVIVEISDDGPGVPESVRSRIFDPFFTTKQARGGTGLGLAVAQALAHEHGGDICLTPGRSTGATFLIELPMRDASASTGS